jgi:EAL domain-containing protein (putative c-di-GMP-specific phosphodiesterase class I)/FixJ family two-component response regulator
MTGTLPAPNRRLLVVDDDPMLVKVIRRWAASWSMEVRCLSDARDVAGEVAAFEPEVILLDLRMPGVDGPAALRALAHAGCTARIVLMSGAGGDVLLTCHEMGRDIGLRMGASFNKPFAIQSLADAIAPEASETRPAGRRSNESAPLGRQDLVDAIENGEIQPYFQPKVDLRTRRVVGAEALARWVRDGKIVTTPDVFIALAEASDLIDPLTMTILDGVTAFLTHADAGLDDEFAVSVNISPLSLDQPDLPDVLGERLLTAGVAPERVVYEITESASISDASRAMETLSRLRLRGHMLSLDDFGTGTSSLVQLYRMPFTELKIDRSFVAGIQDRRDAAVIVRMTLTLARELGLRAVAEGVEDSATAEWLSEHGCPVGQGWFFGRAMPAEGFREWLRSDH